MNNLYYVNNLIFEHYVQKENKAFSTAVFNAELYLARGLITMMYDQAYYACEDNELGNNRRVVIAASADKLKTKWLDAKKYQDVQQIAVLNDNVYKTKPIVDLPKRAFSSSEKKQTTLDMF